MKNIYNMSLNELYGKWTLTNFLIIKELTNLLSSYKKYPISENIKTLISIFIKDNRSLFSGFTFFMIFLFFFIY